MVCMESTVWETRERGSACDRAVHTFPAQLGGWGCLSLFFFNLRRILSSTASTGDLRQTASFLPSPFLSVLPSVSTFSSAQNPGPILLAPRTLDLCPERRRCRGSVRDRLAGGEGPGKTTEGSKSGATRLSLSKPWCSGRAADRTQGAEG